MKAWPADKPERRKVADNERLRRAVQAAITFIGAGTPETAKMVLEQALNGSGGDLMAGLPPSDDD